MRRAALAPLVASLAFVTACTHVTVAAPYGRVVRLLRADEATHVRRQYRAFFAVFGLVRLSGKDPVDVIRDEDLCAARVRVEDNIPDAGIGFLYNVVSPIGFVPQTIVVEGNHPNAAGVCE